MPVFIAALLGALLNMTASLVGRVLVSLGIGVVAYQGMSTSLTWLKDQAVTYATGLPVEVFGLLNFLKVGESVSIITSAMLARLIINGLQGDTIKRWVLK